jgi:hypothetical protein
MLDNSTYNLMETATVISKGLHRSARSNRMQRTASTASKSGTR